MLIAQFGGPALVFGLAWGLAMGRGIDPALVLGIALTAAFVAAGWFGWVAWLSPFGSLHMLLSPFVLLGLVFWPLSELLVPIPLEGQGGLRVLWADALTLTWHLLVLGWGGRSHSQRLSNATTLKGGALQWDGLRVSVVNRLLTLTNSGRDEGTQVWWAAAASAPAYALLMQLLGLQGLGIILVGAAHAFSLWIYLGPLGRMLGQGIRLRQLELSIGGARFVSDRFRWMESERQRYMMGRLLRRVNPVRG